MENPFQESSIGRFPLAVTMARQYELLQALVRLHPEPLIDLRDRVGLVAESAAAQAKSDEPKLRRSRSRAALIREARKRVQALPPAAPRQAAPAGIAGPEEALNGWAARWKLHALLDLAPHMLRYWAKRPGQAERLFFPVVRPLRRSPRTNENLEADDPAQPLLADPDYESENDFLDRAREHYRARAEALR